MAEADFRCNICSNGKLYTSREANEHKIETGHNSWRMVKRKIQRRNKMYVYWKSEPGLWTVGYYSPDGERHPESDWDSKAKAAARVNYLNGGKGEEQGRP